MKFPDPVVPIFVDLWFIFLPLKTNQLIRCPERPFTLGPLGCRPVNTMQTLYEERDETADTDLTISGGGGDMESEEPRLYLKAHKIILMASSEVFRRMLSQTGDFVESRTLNISLPPVSPNAAKLFLKFIYGGYFGKNHLGGDESQAFSDIFDLMSLGHYYGMSDLKNASEKGLMYYIRRNTISSDEVEEQLFYALNTLAGSTMEINGTIYISLLLYGLLKTDSIEAAMEYSKNERLKDDLKTLINKTITMCCDGPADCDYCRLINNKLCALRFTDMYI